MSSHPPMRILHLVHQYPPDYLGGTELYTQQLGAALTAREHRSAVFFRRSGAGSQLDSWEEPNGNLVWAAVHGDVTPTGRFRTSFGDSAIQQQWLSVLDTFKPTIVHIQHLMGLPTQLIKPLIQRNIPYLITFHDYWWRCANAQLLTNYDESLCDGPRLGHNCARCGLARANRSEQLAPLIAPLFWTRNQRLAQILRKAAALICPTQFVFNKYAELGVDMTRGQVIPHGIDLPPEPIQSSNSNPRPLRVLYVGGIAPQKGIHVLLEACRGMDPAKLQVTVYGDLDAFPDYVASLRTIAGPTTQLAGRLQREHFWAQLADTDVVVIPAIWYETASLVIQEAFAVGVPVVASDIGGMSERIRDGVDGFLIPAGDVSLWRATIAALVQNPARVAELRKGIQPVRSIDAHVDDIVALYRDLQGEAPR